MTGRAVAEWIGRTPDSKVPTSVRTRVFLTHGGICHISKRRIGVGDAWELEHVKPLAMGGEHREANMAPALVQAHREKTSQEAGARAKADRVRAKHLGAWPKSKRPLKSRGFEPSRGFAR